MFFDRLDAGERLAERLLHYKGKNVVVYALPRGGVVLGQEVAVKLRAPLDLVITRKIGHPFNKEFALCAITEDGERVCDEFGLCGVDESWIELESAMEQREAQRRHVVYKRNERIIPATGRVAILVDDGVATGLTMKAAIHAIKKQDPQKIVVAVPVAPHRVVTELRQIVDDVVVLEDAQYFAGSVGSYYIRFDEVSDDEVIDSLHAVSSMHAKSKRSKRKRLYQYNSIPSTTKMPIQV
jgi:predicted phosphoribosyltransferase